MRLKKWKDREKMDTINEEILIIRLCIYYQVSTYESHTKFLQISEFKCKIEIDS